MQDAERAQIARGRLVFAKRMFVHGCDHSGSDDGFSRALAIHHFQAAVETTLKAIIYQESLGTDANVDRNFDSLWNGANEAYKRLIPGSQLPLRREMKSLNDIRNLIQHHAYQADEKVAESRSFVRDFLEEVFRHIFATSLDGVSLADLIQDVTLRTRVKEAEQHTAAANYKMAAAACSLAFAEAERKCTLGFTAGRHAEPRLFPGPYEASEPVPAILRPWVEKTHRRLGELEDAVAKLSVPIDPSRRHRFLRDAPTCRLFQSVTVFSAPSDKEWDAGDFWPLYSFVVDTILNWQECGLLPPEQQPGGKLWSTLGDPFEYVLPAIPE